MKTKHRQGCRKRFAKVKDKALNYKGFGNRIPANSNKTHWYYIEYNRETETEEKLIELHWLKIQEPEKSGKKFLRQVMELAGVGEVGFAEIDFLAVSWLGWSMSTQEIIDKEINMGFLFRASKFGDTGIRFPISRAEGVQDFHDPNILSMIFRFCEIERIVPGDQVSLAKRK